MVNRFEVEVWETESKPVGRVLLLPGGFYTVDHPILYWIGQVAAGAGWQVSLMRWSREAFAEAADPVAFVEEAADVIDAGSPAVDVTVVIAKSAGTRAARWANARSYSYVWLTPALADPTVREALAIPGPPSLIVGGTADGSWDHELAGRLRGDVVEIEGADHGLHVGTDWRASIDALGRVLGAVEDHLADQAPALP